MTSSTLLERNLLASMGSSEVLSLTTFITFGESRCPFQLTLRWLPFDPSRNWPDLGPRFAKGERALRDAVRSSDSEAVEQVDDGVTGREDMDDEVDLSWATVLKRTFEAYLRAERPNAYGEELLWESV